MRLIGLTGRRGVGKSTVALILMDCGFVRAHSFGPGKAAAEAYFRHLGADPEVAYRMANVDLKDTPSPLLPGHATPRLFMEQLGKFMGSTLGPEWTLGSELTKVEREYPNNGIVVESVVYEASVIRARGGSIYRVVRNVDGPAGLNTDEAQAAIEVDGVIENNGSIEDLREKALSLNRLSA